MVKCTEAQITEDPLLLLKDFDVTLYEIDMCGRLDTYILSFSHLKAKKDKSRWASVSNYRSPEQPLVLLAVLDHIARGEILRNFIQPTVKLQETYHEYFAKLYPELEPPSIAPPFAELAQSTFWELLPKPHAKNVKLQTYATVEEFNADFFGAKFSDDLYMLLQMQHSRDKLRKALVTS